MRLLIVHYHLRPGGIRRVIELAAPHLVQYQAPRVTDLTLAVGEALDTRWNESFTRSLPNTRTRILIEPALGYAAEQQLSQQEMRRRIRDCLERLLQENPRSVVWAHNLGIGRNLLLSVELARACNRHHVLLVAHHHDWWFDNRWQRWSEFQKYGARSLARVAPLTIVTGPYVRHATINRADSSQLRRYLGTAANWLPNLAGPLRAPRRSALAHARAWLSRRLGSDNPRVWIFPCRLLRRKNIAEALLLTRWLRPGAWLVTTGGVSSEEESAYAQALETGARKYGWPLRLGILNDAPADAPGIPELLGASETVLLTSLQEGFGLPYLEASAAGRPLVARVLSNIAPDLAHFGFRFPQSYSQVLVHPALFDWDRERLRQEQLFEAWRGRLPRECRKLVGQPAVLAAERPCALGFNRLTLKAQFEVLRHGAEESWKQCLPLNPQLEEWRNRAQRRRLQPTPWPAKASRWLSGAAYANQFFNIVKRGTRTPVTPESARAAQMGFIKAKLAADQLYPLLWDRQV